MRDDAGKADQIHFSEETWEQGLRQQVSSVGRMSDYRAGGLGFEPQTELTLRVLK